jgi:hypothetical protein
LRSRPLFELRCGYTFIEPGSVAESRLPLLLRHRLDGKLLALLQERHPEILHFTELLQALGLVELWTN